MITGGDGFEVTYDNPDVGSGRWFFKASEDWTIDTGGLTTADDAANIDSGGNFMNIKTTKPWMASGTAAWDKSMNARKELQKMQGLSNSFSPTKFTIGGVDRIVYAGTGSLVGPVEGNAGKATISFKMMGSGVLTQLP